MRTAQMILSTVLIAFSATFLVADDVAQKRAGAKPTANQEPLDDSAVAEGGVKTKSGVVTRKELYDKFISSMKNTVMVGRFTIDGMDEGKRREESYEIKRVVKADEGDFWNIFARMKFGDVDVTLPFPVEVKWAGTTPVITVDELKLIGMGDAFDARIVISDNKYAGTWRHGKVGGLMFGRIEPAKSAKPTTSDKSEEKSAAE